MTKIYGGQLAKLHPSTGDASRCYHLETSLRTLERNYVTLLSPTGRLKGVIITALLSYGSRHVLRTSLRAKTGNDRKNMSENHIRSLTLIFFLHQC